MSGRSYSSLSPPGEFSRVPCYANLFMRCTALSTSNSMSWLTTETITETITMIPSASYNSNSCDMLGVVLQGFSYAFQPKSSPPVPNIQTPEQEYKTNATYCLVSTSSHQHDVLP